MTSVKFRDVVRRANTPVDKDNTNLEYYVGGEHIDSGEVLVTKRGIIKGSTIGPMFYFGFKAGDVLIVSRNPHLKKAGRVNFDGVCSEKTFVVETKDNNVLLQEYLPFVVQNELFWKYAEKNKSGSVNYFVNWTTIEKYEFNLPSIEEQQHRADLLWAAENQKQAIKQALSRALILKKSLAKEAFINGKKITIGDCVEKIVGGGTPSRAKAEYYIGDIPWATVKDIEETDKEKYSTMEYINQNALKHSASNLIDANCLIIATRISLDRQFINKVPMAINQDLRALYLKENVDVEYLYYWFKAHFHEIYNESDGTTVRGITIENVKSLEIHIPDMNTQKKIVNKFTHIDDTIIGLNKLYASLSDIQKMIAEAAL